MSFPKKTLCTTRFGAPMGVIAFLIDMRESNEIAVALPYTILYVAKHVLSSTNDCYSLKFQERGTDNEIHPPSPLSR